MQVLLYLPSVLIPLLLALGAAASHLGLLSPERGFWIFAAGLLLAALGLPVLAGASAFASATGRAWRSLAVRAAVVPLLTVVTLLLPNLARVNPVIHDITTDPDDSLAFTPEVAALRVDRTGEDVPREDILAQQRRNYPDLAPLELGVPQDRAFAAALAAAEQMPSWEVTEQDAAGGWIDAVVTSRLFRFKDDVRIRVQPAAGGSRIDVRSRSRFGGSDFGANATRIRAYLERASARAAAG